MFNYWNNGKIYNVNSIPRYASGFPINESGIYKTLSLNGKWRFKFLKSALEVPSDFGSADFDVSDFDYIDVPSEWQIKGYDTPIYTNIKYPYAIEAIMLPVVPHIHPDKNSVGLYSREFVVDEGGDNVFLHFGGINSAAEIYVNGNFVGYSEDSFDFQEYDITKYVRFGENRLDVIVFRYTKTRTCGAFPVFSATSRLSTSRKSKSRTCISSRSFPTTSILLTLKVKSTSRRRDSD